MTPKKGAEGLDLDGAYDSEDFIDVILRDWNMPIMNGLDLLKQIRICDADMLFIMVSGKAHRSVVAEAKACGVNELIEKPFSSEELAQKLGVVSRIVA